MKPNDKARAQAAIELADALNAEFCNPSSTLKGIGKETMEKLLVYHKMADKTQRLLAKKLAKEANEKSPDDSTL
jgi:endonuclease III-like uncharacterized protein